MKEVNTLNEVTDIDLADYQAGEGRSAYTLDGFTGATVSTNNIIRMLHAIGQYHGTDAYFGEATIEVVEAGSAESTATTEEKGEQMKNEEAAPSKELAALPAPVDTTKSFQPNPDATETIPCQSDSFSPGCGSVNPENLIDYLNREDVLYIDLRDYEDYSKKHLRNFEVIPFFAWIWNAEAHENSEMIQLYGGDVKDPIPVYEESDKLLEFLFPKDKVLFLMCQSGGRVGMLMDILAARGWDMSKVYNVGGMAQYSIPAYRDLTMEMPEFIVESTYNFEGLTRIAP